MGGGEGIVLDADGLRETKRLAGNIDALLDEAGGPAEVRELAVSRFRCQLDNDDEGAARVLRRIKAARDHHAAAGQLLRLFGQAVDTGSMPLAVGSYAGLQALVRRTLAESVGEAEP